MEIFGVSCAPGIHKYVYGDVPPVTVLVAVPSHTPLQLAFVCAMLTCKSGGCVIVAVYVAVQLWLSVTVQVYEPGHKPEMDGTVCPPGAHKKVYGPVPPVGATVAMPLHAPKQVTFVLVPFGSNGAGCVMMEFCVTVQPFASVTVSV